MQKIIIQFYKVKDENGYISNFFYSEFNLDGKSWKTVEHYFQSQKFKGTEYEEEIRNAKTAIEAAKRGREDKDLRDDWEKVKDDIMRKAVLQKFLENRILTDKLLGTGNKYIVEKTKNDYYWGIGEDGSGKNMLGKILMEIREKLRNISLNEEKENTNQEDNSKVIKHISWLWEKVHH